MDNGVVTAQNDASGFAVIQNVPAGAHTVTEIAQAGWTQTSVLPQNGIVTVTGGTSCASVTFLNRQNETGGPDLTIQKTGPSTVVKGNQIVYTITVQNTGTQTASQVVVNDTIPAGLQFVTSTGASCAQTTATNVACTLGNMNAGASTQFTLTFLAPAAMACPSAVQNTAVVSTTSNETNTGNNNSNTVLTQITCPVTGQADVSVQKSGPQSAVRGTNVSYTLTVSNNGSVAADGIVLTDAIFPGLTYVSSSETSCSQQGSNVVCTLGTLAAGGTRPITITLGIPAAASCQNSTIQNVATVTTSTGESNTANNTSSTVSTSVTCNTVQTGCIDIVKETFDISGNQILAVPQFTFTLDGNRTAQNDNQGKVRFSDVSVGTHTVIETVLNNWQLQNVTPANGTVNVVAGSNCAQVLFRNRQITANDFTISKTDGESEVEAGDTLTYTITVKNNSSQTVNNVIVTDELPDEVEFDQCSNSCVRNGRFVNWNNLSFTAGEQKTLTVKVDVDSDADGEIRNTARVFEKTATDVTNVDDGDDNDDDDDFKIDLVKEASSAEVFPGGIVEYTLRIKNTGNGKISDLTVEDKLPGTVTIVDDGDADKRNGSTLTWEIDELDENETWTVRYRVSISASSVPGEILRNSVRVTDDGDEIDETESVTVSVIGNLPQTGIIGSAGTMLKLKPIHRNTRSASLPIVIVVTLVGLGTGAGVGLGRRFLLGL